MIRYVLRRILLLIPIIIGVSLLVYTLMELAPGTVIDSFIGEGMTTEDLNALRAQYDLDKPMLYRYGKYMLNLLRGDLGISYRSKIPVWNTYIQRLPNTLMLSAVALVLGSVVSIPMGIQAAMHAGTLRDNATTSFTLIGLSMPNFWTGLLLMLLFAYQLHWLPAGNNDQGFKSLIMPGVCSALVMTAISTRQTRASMLEVLKADFLRTARAKGVPENVVIRKHALGNALIPTVTAIGTSLCYQLAGSAVVEQVFAWPGVGRMMIEGVLSRDIPVIMGCAIMTSILYSMVMLAVDLIYAFLDPRIKAQYASVKKIRRKTA